jgi:pRiA4b ORF-3-like protein
MKRRPKSPVSDESPLLPVADAPAILQVKVWLTGISPMVWRRVLVPSGFTLRELHGVIQVAMGWDGCDNEYWPTCADEFWPTSGGLTC